jgi:hypothetical protein
LQLRGGMRNLLLLTAILIAGCTDDTDAPEAVSAGDGKADGFGCPSATELANQFYEALPEDYEAHTAAEKQAVLWNLLTSTEYGARCRPAGGTFLQGITAPSSVPSLPVTFEHASDQLPAGRNKFLHPFGAVAEVELSIDLTAPRYTGVLAPGTVTRGVTRFSLAGDPNLIGFTPGMALKFLIDGRPSVNVVAMDSLMGQGRDRNFFSRAFANGVPDPRTEVAWWDVVNKVKAKAIALVSGTLFRAALAQGPEAPDPNHLGVDHLAAWNPDGTNVPLEARDYPNDVVFEPSAELVDAWDADFSPSDDYRDVLAAIVTPGTVLYTVHAAREGRALERIGELRATSTFVASKWGDFRLFFRHNDHQSNTDATAPGATVKRASSACPIHALLGGPSR